MNLDLERILSVSEKFDWSERWAEVDQKFAEWIQSIPEEYKATIIEVVDQCVVSLAHFCQRKDRIEEHERKILLEARQLNPSVQSIEEMHALAPHQLEYIAEKSRSKYGLYSLIQGGVAGLGHPLALLADLPALLVINLNMIQSVSSAYGYSLKSPYEQILALKVLHAATLSKTYHQAAWNWLLEQYHDPNEFGIYVGQNETIVQQEWLETLAKQLLKGFSLYGIRKLSGKKLSLLGAVTGAGLNYLFTNEVGEFALRFYQYRFGEEHGTDEHSGT